MLLQLLVVIVEVSELVRQDIGVWAKVEGRLSKALLQSNDVEAESVLASDLIRLGEMIDLLILIKAFVLVAFA